MQSALFNIISDEEDQFPIIETHLSFEPFLKYLKRRYNDELLIRRDFLTHVLHDFDSALAAHGPVNNDNIFKFEHELQLIHATLNPLCPIMKITTGL